MAVPVVAAPLVPIHCCLDERLPGRQRTALQWRDRGVAAPGGPLDAPYEHEDGADAVAREEAHLLVDPTPREDTTLGFDNPPWDREALVLHLDVAHLLIVRHVGGPALGDAEEALRGFPGLGGGCCHQGDCHRGGPDEQRQARGEAPAAGRGASAVSVVETVNHAQRAMLAMHVAPRST